MSTQDVRSVITSKLFSLNTRDWLRGAVIAVGAAVTSTLLEDFTPGGGGIDAVQWKEVLNTAIGGLLAYLALNLATKPKIMVLNPSEQEVEAVKHGEAKVAITPTDTIPGQ